MNHSTETSITQTEANAKAAKPTNKGKIVQFLRENGPATPEQISVALDMHYRSVQPRISELLKEGKVYTTGKMTETTLRRNSAEVAAYAA